MDTGEPNLAFCILHNTDTFGKGMKPITLSLSLSLSPLSLQLY